VLFYIYNHDVTLTLYINWTVFFTSIKVITGEAVEAFEAKKTTIFLSRSKSSSVLEGPIPAKHWKLFFEAAV